LATIIVLNFSFLVKKIIIEDNNDMIRITANNIVPNAENHKCFYDFFAFNGISCYQIENYRHLTKDWHRVKINISAIANFVNKIRM
jgi:hypothetical protein